jgi:hypothetical protein
MTKLILSIATAAVVLGACEADRSAVSLTQPSALRASSVSVSDAATLCDPCTLGPLVFTRKTGTPVTETIRFSAAPVAFIVDIDNLGTEGANADVSLNGTPMVREDSPSHVTQSLVLSNENTLVVRLTGKPGSQLRVAIWPLKPAVVSISIQPRSLLLLPYDSARITANVVVVGGTSNAVTWSVIGDPNVSVSPDGVVKSLGIGLAPAGRLVATSAADPSKADSIPVAVYAFEFSSPPISTLVATGPSSTTPSSVNLQATVCRPIAYTYPQFGPFLGVEFFALSNGVPVSIGTGVESHDDFGPAVRCWHWDLLWTPGNIFGLGLQSLFATGTPVFPFEGSFSTHLVKSITTVAP